MDIVGAAYSGAGNVELPVRETGGSEEEAYRFECLPLGFINSHGKGGTDRKL